MTPDKDFAPWLIDCDVHEHPLSIRDLLPYLDREWQMYIDGNEYGERLPQSIPFVLSQGGTREDAKRQDGTDGGQHVEQVQSQLLDTYDVTYAVLTGSYGYAFGSMPQGDLAAALAVAYNDWLVENWLEKDGRFLGSVTVAAQRPRQAAREIDRLGGHPQIVQVMLTSVSPELSWGHEYFKPIWEAAVRNGLRVAFHLKAPIGLYGEPAHGWPTSYMELRVHYTIPFQTQLNSLICSGVFEEFPDLRIVFVEGGFAWLPPLMWRMDASWRALRREVPWLRRRPSDYIRDHVRLTTQPFEEPDRVSDLGRLIDMMGSDDLLMFSSDYPHWDFDSPRRTIPLGLDQSLRSKIFWENACSFYGLTMPKQSTLAQR